MRSGCDPNFCPPVKEGMVITFEDEQSQKIDLEFLGLILQEGHRFGFFFPLSDEEPVGSSGDVVVLEVTELDEDDQPCAFELVEDEPTAVKAYMAFQRATKDLYTFSA